LERFYPQKGQIGIKGQLQEYAFKKFKEICTQEYMEAENQLVNYKYVAMQEIIII